MPGGQYTNLMFQAQSLGLGSQWTQVKAAYIVANQLCGDIVKVTPSSKVVGDFAQFLVTNNLTKQDVLEKAETLDFPGSVVEYFQGLLGTPTGGFPEPLRSQIIRDKPRIDERPGKNMKPFDFAKARETLTEKFGRGITSTDVLSYALYPKVYEEYRDFLDRYGDLSTLPTRYFLRKPAVGEEVQVTIAEGKTLLIKLLATGPIDPELGLKTVFLELNGETRAVQVNDKSVKASQVTREKATKEPGSIGSPMSGAVVQIAVKQGDAIKPGQVVAVMSAMKMEQNVSSPIGGTVKRILVHEGDAISSGDLIAEISA
jgi:pyruvate carboxylase